MLSPDQHTLTTYLWDRSAFRYKQAAALALDVSPRKIVNVSPADLNHDGRLDLLVMTQNNPGSWWGDDQVIHLEAFVGRGDAHFEAPLKLPNAYQSQPMLIDAQGNMSVDLLGMTEKDKKLGRWKNTFNGNNASHPFQL